MSSDEKSNIDDILADAINDFNLEDENEGENTSVSGPPNMDEFLKLLNAPKTNTAENNAMPSEADMEEMFANFAAQTSEAAGSSPDFLPVLESMMKSILSKDLLYPPLKDLCDKYPDWLADNRSRLSESDFDNYNKQYQIALQLVQTYEQPKEDFDKVLELMQKMQNYGHPPKELVGNTPPQALNTVPDDCKMQ